MPKRIQKAHGHVDPCEKRLCAKPTGPDSELTKGTLPLVSIGARSGRLPFPSPSAESPDG